MSSSRALRSRFATLLPISLLAVALLAGAVQATTLLSGAVMSDTLEANLALARRAVVETIGERHWTLDPASVARDTVETTWQPVRSFAVRLVAGNVKTRCQVALTALSEQRTVVSFHAWAEAERPIECASLRHAGEKANDACARDWFVRLRRAVGSRTVACPESAAQVAVRALP